MKLNRIKLKNFRSFGGEHDIDLNIQEGKNIILIGGKNGAGKSSLFEGMKLCLYGPLTFGYINQNHYYIEKIKSNINNDSLKEDKVESYIKVDFELIEGNKINNYLFIREWIYNKGRINEEFRVECNGEELKEEDKETLLNNLYSIISPKMLDYFFFDGEKIADFFINEQNNNMMDFILSINNLDSFSFLKDVMIKNILSQKKGNDKKSEFKNQYYSSESKYADEKKKYEEIKSNIDSIEEEISLKKSENEKFKKSFRLQGGMFSHERDDLIKKYGNLERERDSINQNIKNFSNEELPWIILKKELVNLTGKLEEEDKKSFFIEFKNRLTIEEFEEKISSSEKEKDIYNKLISYFAPEEIESESITLNYSAREMIEIHNDINKILQKDDSLIIEKFNRYHEITEELNGMREKISSSSLENELNDLLNKIDKNNEDINKLEEIKNQYQEQIIKDKETLDELYNIMIKSKNRYYEYLRHHNVKDLSNDMINLIDEFLNIGLKRIRENIEKNFMHIIKNTMRKDNFIDNIKIDDEFNVEIFQYRELTKDQISNIYDNMKFDEISKKFGSYITDITPIKAEEKQNVLVKIEIDSLSKGEKQLYVMCLYWAVIKASKAKMPFIMDTPFARIDQTHRENIANNFLKTISRQVIMLSTDSEIDSNLYKVINNLISKEYLLDYDENNEKTNVKDNYFFESEANYGI